MYYIWRGISFHPKINEHFFHSNCIKIANGMVVDFVFLFLTFPNFIQL